MFTPLEGMFHAIGALLIGLVVIAALSVLAGTGLAAGLRLRGLRWTWAALLVLPAMLLGAWSMTFALAGIGTGMVGCGLGMMWHSNDLLTGGNYAEVARGRIGVLQAIDRAIDAWRASCEQHGWLHDGALEIGRDDHGQRVSIPAGDTSGSHTLILGATGSGKTCGEAWIACRLIEHGRGAIVIDPKGDGMLREELRRAAAVAGAPFGEWTPQGPLAYNPFARGGDTEIADKALAGERFTEPHYLRQAQRYLGHAVRAMHAAKVSISAGSLMAHMDPNRLEETARELPEEQASVVQDYLDSLNERQKRDLAGVRDRLSILAESDIARWLAPQDGVSVIDLHRAIEQRTVVYFSLEADRRPLLAKMLGAAIVADLVTLAAERQDDPVPTVVLIDEFAALGTELVGRLFSRARSAGMSLILATQEMADLKAVGDGSLRDQVIGNLESVIAYRQNVPASAELLAGIAGTRPSWITTQQTARSLFGHGPSGRGSRTLGHEYEIHPSRIKKLRTGQALVIALATGRGPTIVQIHHPGEAHR